ncbi:MAG: 3-deoxy-D-manno-octulosonic acid transferase [Rhodoferax sp.]
MRLLQPLVPLRLRRRARAEPVYAQAIEERFGHYGAQVPGAVSPGYVWVHAVSLGETRACAALVAQLRQALPDMRLLLTHGTATGRTQGQSLLRQGDVQVWQPWDTPGAVARFLTRFRPRIGLLVETEVWPNLVHGCNQAGVPLCLVNARMSEKSLRKALRLRSLAAPAYGGLRAVWAQSEADASRLRQLGARVAGVLGNFKFDAAPDVTQWEQGQRWRSACGRPVVMLASSREGEEAQLLGVLQSFRALAPVNTGNDAIENIANRIQWLVVPRHPQRFESVVRLFREAGLRVAQRSQWGDTPAQADIWVGDSLGEMALYYGMADVALLGGSFAPLGGQNLIEAAACSCPVVMGPHTFNFAEAAALARGAGAALAVPDLAAGVSQALDLVRDGARLAHARASAQALAQAHQGAAARTAQAVAGLLQARA